MGKKCCSNDSEKCSDVVNCNTSQYQRLDKLRNHWSLVNTASDHDDIFENEFYNRNGNRYDYSGFNVQLWTPYLIMRVDPDTSENVLDYVINTPLEHDLCGNLMVALTFVIAHKNTKFEGCKNQVYGWYVNFKNNDLIFIDQTEGVDISLNRLTLYNKSIANLTIDEKKSKCVFDRFFNMSQNIISCNDIPSTEGDIVEVTDSCGQKWLVAYNFADGLKGFRQQGNGIDNENDDNEDVSNGRSIQTNGVLGMAENGRYVFVACKL